MSITEKDITVNSFSLTICGMFRYDKAAFYSRNDIENYFVPWQHRLSERQREPTRKHLLNSYYDSFLSNMYPEVLHAEMFNSASRANVLNHFTDKQLIEKPTDYEAIHCELQDRLSDFSMKFSYIDVYLFPEQTGVFSINIVLEGKPDLAQISNCMYLIRQPSVLLCINGEHKPLYNFIEDEIIKPINGASDWTAYNPQLKLFSLIDIANNIDTGDLLAMLYDLGNVARLGTAAGNNEFSPSKTYYNDLIENHTISVYNNWAALALYDTFTRISINYPDTYRAWENEYFNIYVHCLHLKFYMYYTNSQLSDIINVSKRTKAIRNEFIAFLNKYQHIQISYKFLPDKIKDRLFIALDIPSETEHLEQKVQRINELSQEAKMESSNLILYIIALLGIVQSIVAFSDWFVKLGISDKFVYPNGSLFFSVLLVSLIGAIFLIRNKKR